MTRYLVQRQGDVSHFIKDFETREAAQVFIENYYTRDVLVITECEVDDEDDCIDLPLDEKAFDTLVDLMQDNDMDFEVVEPSYDPKGHIVLKFKDGVYFRCLLVEFAKAVQYVNNPDAL